MKFFSPHKNILLILFIAAIFVFAGAGAVMAQSSGTNTAQPAASASPAAANTPAPANNPTNPPLAPNVSQQSGWSMFSIGGITGKVIGFIAWVMGTILGYVSGIFFAIGGYLVDLALRINLNLLNSPIVSTGWAITLNFANLGFVFAIIVIAFATIFRVQSYQMQQTLWKLIVAALLVNFSLVIAGAFISISDIFSNFFMDRIGGATTTSAWGEAFAGMFNAQALLKVGAGFATSQTGFGGVMDNFSTGMLQGISSILFAALFTTLASIALLATAIMLLIRYIYLGILLILSPLVWLLWIFPGTSGLWKQWWSKFLNWTFFAPIMLFFISLSIYSITYYSSEVQNYARNPVLDAAAGGSLAFSISQIGQMVIVIGLVIGGLMAAQSMGIAFSGIAMGWATNTSKAFGGWVGRKGIRLGTFPARTAAGQKVIEGMQKVGAGGGLTGFLARNTVGRLGNVLSTVGVKQGESLIGQAEARHKNLSDKQLAMRVSTMTNDERVAAFARLAKNKNLDMVPDMAKYIKDERTKKIFESYGKGKEYGDMEKTAGFNTAMLTGKEINSEGKKVDISLEDAAKKFRNTYSIKDYEKLQGNIFGEKAAFGLNETEHANIKNVVAESIFEAHPGAISKVRASLKGDDIKKFQNRVDDYIESFEKKIDMPENMRKNGSNKDKLAFIKGLGEKPVFKGDKSMKLDESWVQGLYNSRKNFGGSLFGGGYTSTTGEEENKTT